MPLSKSERSAINRENASKSTGPRTPAGKLRSSMNSFRHGLTARQLTLHPDEASAYIGHHARTIRSLRPWGPEEEDLVTRIADNTWLIDRAVALEINSRALAAMPLAESDEEINDDSKPIDMIAIVCADHHVHVQPMQQTDKPLKPRSGSFIEWIGRHRYRIERTVFKLTSDLKVIQKKRIEFAAQTRILKTQHGDAYNPAIHGPFRDDDFDEATSPALAACALPPKNEANAYDFRERLEELSAGMEDNRPPRRIEYSWAAFPFADGPQPTDPVHCGGGGLPLPKPDSPYPTKKNEPKSDAPKPGAKLALVLLAIALLTLTARATAAPTARANPLSEPSLKEAALPRSQTTGSPSYRLPDSPSPASSNPPAKSMIRRARAYRPPLADLSTPVGNPARNDRRTQPVRWDR